MAQEHQKKIPNQRGLINSWLRIYHAILVGDNDEIERLQFEHERRLGYKREPIESTRAIIREAKSKTKVEIKALIKSITSNSQLVG